jgi:hypothetical protein
LRCLMGLIGTSVALLDVRVDDLPPHAPARRSAASSAQETDVRTQCAWSEIGTRTRSRFRFCWQFA